MFGGVSSPLLEVRGFFIEVRAFALFAFEYEFDGVVFDEVDDNKATITWAIVL